MLKMKHRKIGKSAAILFAFLELASCVLTGYEQNPDISADRKFGCIWSGGITHGVSCTCTEEGANMQIYPGGFSALSTEEIRITNCHSVTFTELSIHDMRNLRTIRLTGINSLQFDPESLTWYGFKTQNDPYEGTYDLTIPSVKVYITNSNVTKISGQAFKGRISEISISDSTIHSTQSFAFSNLLQNQKISITNTTFHNIGLQTFKHFDTIDLELKTVKADLIPSRMFSEVSVSENLVIENCDFGIIRPGAFSINNPRNFEVRYSRIQNLDGEAFKVSTRGNVLFKNNTISVVNDGAFRGISPNRDEIKNDLTIVFDSNTFKTLSRDSLTVTGFNRKIINLNIEEICNCKKIDKMLEENAFDAEIRCVLDGSYVTVREYQAERCSIIDHYSGMIIILSVVSVLAVIVIVILVLYYKRVVRSNRYGGTKEGKSKNLSLIVPDGRTYRETELHVIVERTELLTTDL